MSATLAENKKNSQRVLSANYAKSLGLEMADIQSDSLTLKMSVSSEKHTNPYGLVHGGVIMSLADTAMGCACFCHGNTVTTMDMNINFIKGAKPVGCLKAVATIIHSGSRTMVVEAEIYNGEGVFLAKARGTFFITGKVADFEAATC